MKKNVTMGLTGLLAVVLAVATVSCAKSPRGVVKENQAELTGKLATLEAVCSQAAAFKKLESDAITLPAGAPPLELGGVCFGQGLQGYPPYYQRFCNAQLFALQELQEPLDADPAKADLFGARELVWKPVADMVKNGKYPADKEEALKALRAYPHWRYGVVLVFRACQWPQAGAQLGGGYVNDRESRSNRGFTGGTVEGDALLFDLTDARMLGGFPFAARSSENVESVSYGGDAGKAFQQALARDFLQQVRKAVADGIEKRIPADRIDKRAKDK